ncbi:MAG: GNAT family N-acetyltransferase [Clostridiales bacterium]|nr:GNAT family N-acetyltransferase [Clostridiales bacterium]
MEGNTYDIRLGHPDDLDDLAALYDAVNDYLDSHFNYGAPVWKKGRYPTRKDAQHGMETGELYLIREAGTVLGSLVLNREQPEFYQDKPWHIDAKEDEIFVVHTVVSNPAVRKRGVARLLLRHAVERARRQGGRTVRLDTFRRNTPARRLYESCGFRNVREFTLPGSGLELVVMDRELDG